MQSHFTLGASTSPTHSKWNDSIGQPGLSQAIILPDSGPPQRHQNSLPAVATSSLDFCLADLCFLEAAAFISSTSLSSLPYRIKMCYPNFNVFSTQKGLLCKFLTDFHGISCNSLLCVFKPNFATHFAKMILLIWTSRRTLDTSLFQQQ